MSPVQQRNCVELDSLMGALAASQRLGQARLTARRLEHTEKLANERLIVCIPGGAPLELSAEQLLGEPPLELSEVAVKWDCYIRHVVHGGQRRLSFELCGAAHPPTMLHELELAIVTAPGAGLRGELRIDQQVIRARGLGDAQPDPIRPARGGLEYAALSALLVSARDEAAVLAAVPVGDVGEQPVATCQELPQERSSHTALTTIGSDLNLLAARGRRRKRAYVVLALTLASALLLYLVFTRL